MIVLNFYFLSIHPPFLLISCEQKFAPKCWHDIARHVESLKIDEGLKRLELMETKMSDDSRLAMRFR